MLPGVFTFLFCSYSNTLTILPPFSFNYNSNKRNEPSICYETRWMGAAWERWRRRNVSACGGTISRMDNVAIKISFFFIIWLSFFSF